MTVIHAGMALLLWASAPQDRPPHTPIAQYLVRRGAPPARAETVAQHIVRASREHRMDIALLTALVTVENPTLRASARSTAGAVGLMQVMPFWRRTYSRKCGAQLTDDRTSLCMGIAIFQSSLAQRKTTYRALLSYNGCRNAAAPCGRYPTIVLRHRKAVAQLLASQETL